VKNYLFYTTSIFAYVSYDYGSTWGVLLNATRNPSNYTFSSLSSYDGVVCLGISSGGYMRTHNNGGSWQGSPAYGSPAAAMHPNPYFSMDSESLKTCVVAPTTAIAPMYVITWFGFNNAVGLTNQIYINCKITPSVYYVVSANGNIYGCNAPFI
jgi:hypothetical protein